MDWSVLVQRAMSPRSIVIARAGFQDPASVRLAERDDMVGAPSTTFVVRTVPLMPTNFPVPPVMTPAPVAIFFLDPWD